MKFLFAILASCATLAAAQPSFPPPAGVGFDEFAAKTNGVVTLGPVTHLDLAQRMDPNNGGIIYRSCPACPDSHKHAYYKRLTPVPPQSAFATSAADDFADLFINNWMSQPDNLRAIDFNIYSSYEDAMTDTNPWAFCNYDDPTVGAFRDCGPVGYVPYTWITTRPGGRDFSLQVTAITAGPGGDPHFTTWKNEHFEYHGQCDLTLAKDADFANGLGLDIQIRTKIVRYWSYIKSVAIKIGNDILEIEGSADANDSEAHYWANYDYQGELETFAGFPVTQQLPSVYKRSYTIDLSSKYPGASIVVQLYKEFVRVKFNGGEQVFGKTVGLLGDYKTGKLVARDGSTVMDDFTEFGDEWQVLPSEPKLFREVAQPQFPELCIKPEDPRGDRKRRLAESTISIEEAEAACAGLKDPLSIKDCVYDILATQDLDMVGAF